MPQERLSSLGDTTTLGPEWLQRGIRTSNRAALDASSPKSGEARDRDGISPAANYRYGRDQLLLFQSSMELPSPPRMATGRPKPPDELNALQQKFPVFGAMTKEHLVSEGVLPASTLEDKQVAGTLRGRAEGRGRGNKDKGRGKGGVEEAPHSPVQTSPGGADVGRMGLPAPPLELPDRQVSGGDESRAGPRNPMSSFLDRVLKKGPAPAEPKAEPVPSGLPPGAGLPPPTAALPSGESGEASSPTFRPPVPEKPPPPPPGPGEAVPEMAKELPVRPGPLPSSPPQHPPTLGMAAFEPQPAMPDPQPSPQRAPVNLANALAAAGGVTGVAAAQAQALERELALGLGENLMAAQPQALQPGRVTAPQRQALPRLDDPSVAARLQEDMEEFEKGNCWYYKDPSGKIQGPFTTQQMRNWHQVGYFKSELPIRFKDGNFYRLDHLYPEAPFQQLPHTADPRAQAAQVAAAAQAQAQAQQQAQAAQAQLQAQAAALARQRALLADPTLASSGFEYMRLQQAHAAQVNAQAQFATMKSLMGMNPAYGGYDDRRWPEELKAMGLGGPSGAQSAAQAAAAQLERERQQQQQQRLAALKEQQRLEQQRLEREHREHQRQEEQQRLRLAQAQAAQAAAVQAAAAQAAAQQAAQQAAAPAKPPPLVPPVPAPTISPMEAAKEERKKPAQPKKPSAKSDAPGPTQVAPGPVPKEAPPLIASPSEFPTLGGSSEEVVMTTADSSTGFWERPLRPVKVGNEPAIAPKADPKAKAAQKQQQKAKEEEKSEQRRAQVKELLTEYGITLEEPMVTFVMSVNGSSELSDYLEALKVTEKETARRFAEAFLAKGLVEKVEKTKEAPKRKHRIKGKEVDPSMLGFTAVPRGHYES